jgi:signal transduction histidine kinase
LWIGTSNGLAIYQPDHENFQVYRNDPTNLTSISNNRIRTIQEDADGKIWLGTENGLNQWQENTNSFKRYFYNSKEVNNCIFIFPDKQNRLWLSILNKGVYVLDKNTGKTIKSYLPDDKNPLALSCNKIDVFYQDSRGIIWLANNLGGGVANKFGLYRLNQNEEGFIHYLPISGDSSSISNDRISLLTEDEKKRLWIGTNVGLNIYDYEHNRFTRYVNLCIAGYAKNKKEQLLFGLYVGNGLVSVDPVSGKKEFYGEEKGLLHNDLYGNRSDGRIPIDDLGRLWLPNQRGLSVFDPLNKSFANYFEKDGFQTYTGRYFTLKTSNGDIWIGGVNGLNHIVPANLLKKDTTLPSIVITQVTINDSIYSKPDGTIFKKSVAYTNDFKLEYWQKDISFDFMALHFLRSEDNQYCWKLENYDKDWTAPSKVRKASYTNLSPGKYIFRIKASNADGIWNEEGISITMIILPPWWKTWWAYLIYIFLFLGALRIFSKWRERKLIDENEILEARVKERTNSLNTTLENLKSTQSQLVQSEKMASLGELTAGIAHEIQNPLNFVNNFSEVNTELIEELQQELKTGNAEEAIVISNEIKANEQKINHHGKRADAIVKGMLQHSNNSSGMKEPTDINALADEYLRLAYHGLRAKDKSFNATLHTDFDESIGKIEIIPQDIGRVILNLITNAFFVVDEKKKSGIENYEPTVSVSTKKMGAKILICVKDNGNGIPSKVLDKIFQPFFTTKPTGQGTGLGLSLSYDIVKAHGGEIKVNTKVNEGLSNEESGTEFTIQLPI